MSKVLPFSRTVNERRCRAVRTVRIARVTSDRIPVEQPAAMPRCPDCNSRLFVHADSDGIEVLCPECTCFVVAA